MTYIYEIKAGAFPAYHVLLYQAERAARDAARSLGRSIDVWKCTVTAKGRPANIYVALLNGERWCVDRQIVYTAHPRKKIEYRRPAQPNGEGVEA